MRAVARLVAGRRGQRRAFQALVLFCAVALAPTAWLYGSQGSRIRTVADAPTEPVAVVFGAGEVNGVASDYLAHRLDVALALYRAHKVQAILVTGDNSRKGYDEPGVMYTYLVARGVPAVRVVRDDAGFDTWDSCTRARRIFGVDRAVLVSQDYHVRRALADCRAAGIDAYAVGAAETHDATWYYGNLREIPGAGEAALDALFHPDPALLGRPESGVARALADAARQD
ncbi:vancomycin permeability regulator SanA [Kitasatospora sp. MAP12-15]|uniref:SanA/YdcF family protein n=1 Tax=unclassified Kitasatospora TaxID=2633591 RepID=UPI002474B093|nr:ElyC/SanA/YdcF family protein [Kitasatospora sp. MAP12-44]MDH6109011.1 vancomycin permeability regulator SanA [Kitasatospora sp. MAP12-44]